MSYPNLFEANAVHKGTIPQHDGSGTLADAVSCTVTQTTDGAFELDLSYPASGKHADRILVDSLIRVNLDRFQSEQASYRQFFRIVTAERTMQGAGEMIQVHAEHISYDLKWAWCLPVDLTTKSPVSCLNHIRNNGLNSADPFAYYSNLPQSMEYKEFKYEEPFTKREGLLEIAALFKASMEVDNLDVRLVGRNNRTDYVFERGKNLAEFSHSVDMSQGVTGVYLYFKSGEEYQPPVLVAPYKSPYGVPHYVAHNYAEESDTALDSSNLEDLGRAWLAYHTQPEPYTTFSARATDPGDLKLKVFDLVTVVHPGFQIRKEAEVQRIVYDVLHDRYEEIELGNLPRDITDTIAGLIKKTS